MLAFLLMSFASFYILWILYLAVMNLKNARDRGIRLARHVYWLGYPLLFSGLIVDFMINVFILSILFLEIPKETTVTARLKRHNKAGGWRGNVAKKFFEPLLDPFDPRGDHI